MEHKVELIGVDKLIPYVNNARTHSDAQVAQIAASIKEFGFNNPVLIAEDSTIIAGHGRVIAARKLGLTDVPCIRLGHLTPTQRKAYIIADNQLAMNAGWNDELLTIELNELLADDFALELLGFDPEELKRLMGTELTEGLTDEDEAPAVEDDPVTKPGDVWILGKHRLMCGDSTSIDTVEKLMAGGKADMVFTDPPYGMFLDTDYDSMFAADKAHRKTGKRFTEVAGDHEDFAPELITTIFTAFPDAREIFIWGADYFADLIPGRKDGSWVVWDKRCNENMDKVSGNTFELCWSKQKHKRLIARILWSGHHGMAKDDTKTRVHPTQKPVELVAWFFDQWGKDCKVVADLFGGSGSTLIACEKTGRIARLMELDPKYCDVIVKRWQDFTGKEAVLEASKQSFNELSGLKNARQ